MKKFYEDPEVEIVTFDDIASASGFEDPKDGDIDIGDFFN